MAKFPQALSEERKSEILQQMMELSRKLNAEKKPIAEVVRACGALRDKLVREALTAMEE